MDRTTNLRDYVPNPKEGALACETTLAGTAHWTPSEKATNVLKEDKTPPQPKDNLGGENKMK